MSKYDMEDIGIFDGEGYARIIYESQITYVRILEDGTVSEGEIALPVYCKEDLKIYHNVKIGEIVYVDKAKLPVLDRVIIQPDSEIDKSKLIGLPASSIFTFPYGGIIEPEDPGIIGKDTKIVFSRTKVEEPLPEEEPIPEIITKEGEVEVKKLPEKISEIEKGIDATYKLKNIEKLSEVHGLDFVTRQFNFILDALDTEFWENIKSRLRDPDKLEKLRGYHRANKPILLYGPPGCGKTHVTLAFAKEIENRLGEVKFYEVKPSDILDVKHGESEKKINAIFRLAKENSKKNYVILFFDDVQNLFSRRDDTTRITHTDQFISEINEIERLDNILLIGATNVPFLMDAAILSRFKNKIFIPPPDKTVRKKILTNILRDTHDQENLEYDMIAEKTNNYSAREIEVICRSLGEDWLRSHKQEISTDEVFKKIDKTKTTDVITYVIDVKNQGREAEKFPPLKEFIEKFEKSKDVEITKSEKKGSKNLLEFFETLNALMETRETNKAELGELKEKLDSLLKERKEEDAESSKGLEASKVKPKDFVSKPFDDEFHGNYVLLLTGADGVGKFEYCLSLMKHYLSTGQPVVWVTTDKSPEEIKSRVKKTGFDLDLYEDNKIILFIDIQCGTGKTRYGKGLSVDNPANINMISVNIEKAVDIVRKPMRIIFDISPLFLYNSSDELKRFFHNISTKVKSEYGFILYTLQEDMIDKLTMNTFRHFVDGVIEMRCDEKEERQLRVHHMRGIPVDRRWVNFKLTEEGFVLGSSG